MFKFQKLNLSILSFMLCFILSLLFVGCKNADSNKPTVTEATETTTATNSEVVVATTEAITETTTNNTQSMFLKPNEPIITDIYTADPSVHVFQDKLYIYPSHDPSEDILVASTNDGGQYMMEDYHVLSIDDFDSAPIDHGVALHLDDIPWAKQQLWAPDAAYKNDTYYLYFPAKDHDDIFRIGVATSTKPEGPFVAEPDYIPGSHSIDPAVYVEADEAYMVFGGIWGGQIEHWQGETYVPIANEPTITEPALGPKIVALSDDMLTFKDTPQEISILDEAGNPILAGDQNRRFFEAAWIHKYKDQYYLSYSTGTTHFIVYAVSDNIYGPYIYKGKILNPVLGWTSHHSIVEYEDQWYLFYHDSSLSGGIDHKRSVKHVKMDYNDDGTIKTINP